MTLVRRSCWFRRATSCGSPGHLRVTESLAGGDQGRHDGGAGPVRGFPFRPPDQAEMGRNPPSVARRSGPGGDRGPLDLDRLRPRVAKRRESRFNLAAGWSLHSGRTIRRVTDGDGGDRWAASWIYFDISDKMRAGSCPGAGNLSTMEVSKSNAGLLNPLFQATQLGGRQFDRGTRVATCTTRRYMDSPDGRCQVWQGSARCVCKGNACPPCPCHPEREGPREEEIRQRDAERPVQPSNASARHRCPLPTRKESDLWPFPFSG